MKKDYDSMAKVAVIGDSSVGKTNLLLRYVNAEYNQSHIATIGIDFKVKTTQINGYKIKLQIWDTAGQQRFRNLTGTIYQGAQAVLLTYAINNRASFEHLQRWLQDVNNYANSKVILAVAGTKCDLQTERAVTKEEAEVAAHKMGAMFYQTSAKNNINVEDVFRSIAHKMYDRLVGQSPNSSLKDGVMKMPKCAPRDISGNLPSKLKIKENEKKAESNGVQSKMVLQKQDVPPKRKKCC